MCISNKFVGDLDATGCQPHFEKHCLHLQSTAPLPHMFRQVLVVYTGQFLPFIPSRPQSLCSWLFSKLTKVIHLEARKMVRKDPGENPSSELYASGDRNLYTNCRDNEAHLHKPKEKKKKITVTSPGSSMESRRPMYSLLNPKPKLLFWGYGSFFLFSYSVVLWKE